MTDQPEPIADACDPACSEGHTYEGRCAQSTGNACVWPDCLSDGQQAELAAQVLAAERGDETTAGPDQRVACRCDEAPAPDDPGQSRTAPDTPAGGDAADSERFADAADPDGRWREVHAMILADAAYHDTAAGLTKADDGRAAHSNVAAGLRMADRYVIGELARRGATEISRQEAVATPRNAPDLREQLVAALEDCRTLIPEAQADAVLAVVEADLSERAQAAIRQLQQQVTVRDQQLAAARVETVDACTAAVEADLEGFFREWPDEPRNSPWACGMRDAISAIKERVGGKGAATEAPDA